MPILEISVQANAESIFSDIRPSRNPLEYYQDLVWALLAKEFRVRYKSTVLGYAWSVLHPLMFTLVFLLFSKSCFACRLRIIRSS